MYLFPEASPPFPEEEIASLVQDTAGRQRGSLYMLPAAVCCLLQMPCSSSTLFVVAAQTLFALLDNHPRPLYK